MLTDGPFIGLRPQHYRVILVDFPWAFRSRSANGEGRSAKRHYGTMTFRELAALPISDLADPRGCVLILWTTDTHLAEAMMLLQLYGFTYKTVAFYWTKDNATIEGKFKGMGYWTRANPEQALMAVDDEDNQCLLGTIGRPSRIGRDVAKLIESPRREHSRKPDEIHDRIERLVDGPYLELFARERRAGWSTWGNQKRKFDRPAWEALL